MLDYNPLDTVEDVLSYHNWVYERMGRDEIRLNVQGSACNYNVLILWLDSIHALQLVCEYDVCIHDHNIPQAYEAVTRMNTRLVTGHFEFIPEHPHPVFRHNFFMQREEVQHIEDFVDLSLMQCEHHLPVFQILADALPVSPDVLRFAMMDTAGES